MLLTNWRPTVENHNVVCKYGAFWNLECWCLLIIDMNVYLQIEWISKAFIKLIEAYDIFKLTFILV